MAWTSYDQMTKVYLGGLHTEHQKSLNHCTTSLARDLFAMKVPLLMMFLGAFALLHSIGQILFFP